MQIKEIERSWMVSVSSINCKAELEAIKIFLKSISLMSKLASSVHDTV